MYHMPQIRMVHSTRDFELFDKKQSKTKQKQNKTPFKIKKKKNIFDKALAPFWKIRQDSESSLSGIFYTTYKIEVEVESNKSYWMHLL